MTEAILDAARAVMREQGVAALNLHEVARRVRIRPPSLYEYFPNRAAIYDTLFRLGLRQFASHRDRALAGKTTFTERLHAAIESYMSFAQEYPVLWSLLFERPVPGFVPSEQSMDESRAVLEAATSSFHDAIATGEIAPDVPPSQARDFVFAVMHGLAASHLANEPELPVGSGRFGSLVPVAVAVLEAAWRPHGHDPHDRHSEETEHRREQP
ncbi:MAG: TetR/AcrR family transcriptional regulator [Chloroflexi bacterium]|nr:TetR/AcrR family transcriptional regulator [Chloroflexota bacterium]